MKTRLSSTDMFESWLMRKARSSVRMSVPPRNAMFFCSAMA